MPAVPAPSAAAAPVAPPAEATPASSAPIDRNDPVAVVAGPEGGARCSAATEYADESGEGLDPAVAAAWDAARRAATDAGVHLCLADGKRSWDQQVAIAQDYVDKYGAETAKKYALPPESSEHVRGLAVDVQPASAYTWLEARKGSDGFCRTYDNEPWHFEWSAAHITEGCPATVAHPAG
ncbi:D-alanyl-D-alanine carboxypeptidase family protein [Nakamurella flavida]|uniref:D-alanyl-D-alanine carboxypeptidase family protein n=1 Tax=Nakamurella flavida TaxID=363630 RepID=A0A939C118_9ACTN|nr:D-alanyl-D-alanine carboxypeptidase family protein [Nakamurella flavida]